MRIDDLIVEGKRLEETLTAKNIQNEYDAWCGKVRRYMKEAGFTDKEQSAANVKMHYVANEYSEHDIRMSVKRAIKDTICLLKEKENDPEKENLKQAELSLIERLLNNFYIYYRSMYRNPVHKKGTLDQNALKAIQIGNEYDLQRMLYSVLCPIFPTVRQEVCSDNGYGGMRTDIYLDIYDLAIEVKCTRDSMTEKKLAEELGADAFHYNADIIYFFVCDKNEIIKNPEAFKRAFSRQHDKYGKTIKMFILQATEL